jgi:hypothetical protein
VSARRGVARCQRCRRREASWASCGAHGILILCEACLHAARAALEAEAAPAPLRDLATLVAEAGGP